MTAQMGNRVHPVLCARGNRKVCRLRVLDAGDTQGFHMRTAFQVVDRTMVAAKKCGAYALLAAVCDEHGRKTHTKWPASYGGHTAKMHTDAHFEKMIERE